jgi:hypothetical protein
MTFQEILTDMRRKAFTEKDFSGKDIDLVAKTGSGE